MQFPRAHNVQSVDYVRTRVLTFAERHPPFAMIIAGDVALDAVNKRGSALLALHTTLYAVPDLCLPS